MTRPPDHDNSPRGYNWHARRLFGADVDLDALTDEQWEHVADERMTWLRANVVKAVKAVKARQLGRARRLRDRADAVEAKLRGESA